MHSRILCVRDDIVERSTIFYLQIFKVKNNKNKKEPTDSTI